MFLTPCHAPDCRRPPQGGVRVNRYGSLWRHGGGSAVLVAVGMCRSTPAPRIIECTYGPVVPENAILAETDTWSRGPAKTFVANSGEDPRNRGFLARESPDLGSTRAIQPRTADTSKQLRGLKPRGDSDDANRRLGESRLPFLPMDARLDVAPVHYIPAKDDRVIRDSTRSSSRECVAGGLR